MRTRRLHRVVSMASTLEAFENGLAANLQVPAVMPKGSCVIYLSSCLHGSGPNLTADRERIGLNVDYNLARIRTEENQYLSNPPAVTKLSLSSHVFHRLSEVYRD